MYLSWEVYAREGGSKLRVGALGIELEGKLLERLELLHEELLLVRAHWPVEKLNAQACATRVILAYT